MPTLFSLRAKFTPSIFIFLTIATCGLHAQRLPATVVPSNYKLALDPDIAGQKFSGEETITVRAQQPVREIVLNSLGLEISLAEAAVAGETLPAQVAYDEPNEMVRLTFARPAPKGII